MVLIKTTTGWSVMHGLPGDPILYSVRRSKIRTVRQERQAKVWPTFPPIYSHNHRGHSYRLAVLDDLDPIVNFVDRLLAGRDFFCPRGQHIGYFKYKTIVVCFNSAELIGWAVRQKNGSLIHLLVDPEYRGQGIGSHLLEELQPLLIRSKSDQSTGDPKVFYEKHGYTESPQHRVGKNMNIDLLSKPVKTSPKAPELHSDELVPGPFSRSPGENADKIEVKKKPQKGIAQREQNGKGNRKKKSSGSSRKNRTHNRSISRPRPQ